MSTELAVATGVTEGNLCDATTDLAQLQAEIEELNACCTTLSTLHTGMTSVELFEYEFVKLDFALAGHMIATQLCGGIFKDKNQDKEPIIPSSCTDPVTYGSQVH
eukprot:15366604-Ditylum_brightwellii.AAC.2